MLSEFFLFLFIAVCIGYALLDFQLLRGLRRLERQEKAIAKSTGGTNAPPVTLLMAARNEEGNLPIVLDALLAQDYPADKMRIVVVNDRSTDGTEAVLRGYAERHPDRVEYVSVSRLPAGVAPKKNALLHGLERARGEWIAVTDADCTMGPAWLSALSRHFGERVGIVLGPTCCAEPARGFTGGEGLQALEFISHGITAAALVALDFPLNGNANNLAYRRQAFEEAGAFARHGSVVSGDDDFTLQEIHATGNWEVRYCAAPEALVRTARPESWRQFWEQRKRWASKCILYRPRQAAFLMLIFAFYAAIPALMLAGIWHAPLFWLGLFGFAAKTGSDFAVMRRGLRLFGLSPLLRFYPRTALAHIPLILGAVTAGSFGSFTWKGQKMQRKV